MKEKEFHGLLLLMFSGCVDFRPYRLLPKIRPRLWDNCKTIDQLIKERQIFLVFRG